MENYMIFETQMPEICFNLLTGENQLNIS